jgi:predicted nucleotidyltransferase
MTGLTFWVEDRAKYNRGFLCNISVDILFYKNILD